MNFATPTFRNCVSARMSNPAKLIALALLMSTGVASAQSLTTSFVYQGELQDSGSPANGSYDLQFRALSAATGGTQEGPTLCADDVVVEGGRFTTSLDFGGIFGGQRLFLEVSVRSGAAGTCAIATGYTTLAPRQELASTPYATYAVSAAQASTLGGQPRSFFQDATNLTLGTIPDARLSSNIARTNAANVFTGSVQAPSFVGSLAGNAATATNATNLNGQPASFYQSATNITSGTLADVRLSTNVARLNSTNIFTGSITAPTFIGALTGNASTATTASNATNLNNQPASFYTNASNISSGTLAEARLPSSVAKTTDPIAPFSGEVWSNPGFVAFSGTNPSAQATLEWFADQARISVGGSGAGTSNGFLIRTPTDASAFKITDDGSVGIGTQSPEAPLHVRGGGSMGGIVVTPDVTDTQSQIVLSENTTASNAMLMRYNGTTNNIEIRGRAADVESTPHLTIGRDTGTLVVSPATATGDASVQLPASAISSTEIEDEPGADSGSGSFIEIPEAGTITLATTTLTVPGPGIVVVRGVSQFSTCNQLFDKEVDFAVTDSASGSAEVGFTVGVRGGSCTNSVVGVDEEIFTVTTAGAKTFYLRATCASSGARSVRSRITAVYFPTRY